MMEIFLYLRRRILQESKSVDFFLERRLIFAAVNL